MQGRETKDKAQSGKGALYTRQLLSHVYGAVVLKFARAPDSSAVHAAGDLGRRVAFKTSASSAQENICRVQGF